MENKNKTKSEGGTMELFEMKVKNGLVGLGFSEKEAIDLIKKYPETIKHGYDLMSFPSYTSFQIALAEDGKEADIQD